MRVLTLIFTIFFLSPTLFSQYSIGETVITFNDPQRTGGVGNSGNPGRQIETAIFYPADNGGLGVDVASGNFPLVIIAHGFSMGYDAYENLWEHIVSEGYIVALPKTESDLFPAPSHNDFGLDIVNIKESFNTLNDNGSSIFHEKLNGKIAYIGHSMGGGASVLASAENEPDLYIGLASAETDPSAIQSASTVNCPSIIFSGTGDEVTPAPDHQIPIFNALNSSCKYLISIIGGAHCYYANTNLSCDTGEAISGGNITLDREQQQELVYPVITEALNLFLKSNGNTQDFEDELNKSEFEVTNECQALSIFDKNQFRMEIFPNPFQQEFTINLENETNEDMNLTILDATGAIVHKEVINSESNNVNSQNWKSGAYFVLIKRENQLIHQQKVIKK